MIEVIVFCLLALAIAAYVFLPQRSKAAKLARELEIPEDSVLRRHFLTHLRSEDLSLANELEKRLAKAR